MNSRNNREKIIYACMRRTKFANYNEIWFLHNFREVNCINGAVLFTCVLGRKLKGKWKIYVNSDVTDYILYNLSRKHKVKISIWQNSSRITSFYIRTVKAAK